MEFFAYILVLVSALTHAYWNFVLKRSGGTQVFIGLSKLAEVLLFAVPFIYLVGQSGLNIFHFWLFYVVGAALALLNYLFLGQAYRRGDLSLVYPISRAGALLFLPALAYILIGETIDPVGLVAILLIFIGLFAIQLPEFSRREVRRVLSKFKNPATVLALLAALTTAGYTLWDKYSIGFLPPFLYFYAYTLIVAVSYAVFIFVTHRAPEIKKEWSAHKFPILQVGFFNTFTYLLVLYSLQTGKTSYVIALRQLSIAFGAFLGWRLLSEEMPLPKKTGIAILLIGCCLIALAR
jgi:uncharacterized membrane protein